MRNKTKKYFVSHIFSNFTLLYQRSILEPPKQGRKKNNEDRIGNKKWMPEFEPR